jgi:biotin-[acetyl-CoA-carboxylase] ligase BirA-like protein
MQAQIVPITEWPARLQTVVEQRCELLDRVSVLRQTDSTQDAARWMHAHCGGVIVAWQQTAGRGRLGRAWADTGEDGVALTAVIERAAPERLAIAAAIGVARAAESLLQRSVGIKWPNDIVVDGCKLAGVLVEQFDQVALIGIGMNVRQTTWPVELQNRAISLLQLGADFDRLDVIESVLPALDAALRLDEKVLVAEFAGRNALLGKIVTLRCGEQIVCGEVTRMDPMRGLEVRELHTSVWLPAAITTVLAV